MEVIEKSHLNRSDTFCEEYSYSKNGTWMVPGEQKTKRTITNVLQTEYTTDYEESWPLNRGCSIQRSMENYHLWKEELTMFSAGGKLLQWVYSLCSFIHYLLTILPLHITEHFTELISLFLSTHTHT